MTEFFYVMGEHPFVTFFVGIVLITIVHDITGIFKKCDCKEKNNEDESE